MRKINIQPLDFKRFFHNITVSKSTCECCGLLLQMDANLPDETPVRVMKSHDGYHEVVGIPDEFAPDPVSDSFVAQEIFRQWDLLRSKNG